MKDAFASGWLVPPRPSSGTVHLSCSISVSQSAGKWTAPGAGPTSLFFLPGKQSHLTFFVCCLLVDGPGKS